MKLFVDHLTVADCSVLSAEHGMSGESWICDFVLTGALDSQSMVMDFGQVKKQIKAAVDDRVDHKLLVPMQSECLKSFDCHNGIATLIFEDSSGQRIRHQSPESALCLIDDAVISAESVERFLKSQLEAVLPATVEAVEVRLRHEVIDGPYYHYSHGLKKHDGHCQRIAHGHRSRIDIWQNGQPALALMQQVADHWPHIYIGTREDIADGFEQNGRPYWRFAYRSGEGEFLLEMAQDRCDIIEQDSTVECIAGLLLGRLRAQGATGTLRVKAYEGVYKGAIVEE